MMKRRVALLQGAVSLVSLAAVVWWASRQDRPEFPHDGDALATILLAVALHAGVFAARGERWHRILRRNGVPTRRAHSYGLIAVGYMANNVLPARSGDLMRPLLLVSVTGAGKRKVIGTVIAERLLDVAALSVLFVVLAYGLVRWVAVPPLLLLAAAVGAVLLIALALLTLALRRRDVLARARAFVRPLAAASHNLASVHGAALLLLSLGIWALEATVYLVLGRAVGLDVGLLGAAYLVAFTNLFAVVPAAPGYLGTYDVAFVFAAKSLGHPGYLVISYLLLLRFVLFVPITVVGLIVLVTRYGGWSRYRAARVEAMRA